MKAESESLGVLHLEKDEEFAKLLQQRIDESALNLRIQVAGEKRDLDSILIKRSWDLILVSDGFGELGIFELLEKALQCPRCPPVIVLAGAVGEEVATECMRRGANDFVLKSNLSRLLPAIERELVRAETLVAREAFSKQQTILRLAEEAAQVGSWAFDPMEDEFIWSDSMKQLCQRPLTSSKVTLKTYLDWLIEEDREDFLNTIQESVRDNSPFTIKHRITTDNSEVKWFESRGHPYESDTLGNALVGVSIDITDHVESLLALRESKEKAEESERLKSAFLANMSHELRTPLNAIIGLSELMQEPSARKDEYLQWARVVRENGSHLLDLINDLVDSAKISSGDLKPDFSCFDLPSFLEQIRESFSVDPKVGELDGLFLEQAIEPYNRRTIYTDHRRLRQVLLNLIRNALKFTDKGSVVFGYEKVSNEKLRFYVRDTGIGIEASKQAHIFERFRQIHQNINRDFQGVGLGLSISKGLVAMLGGELAVDSKPGKGSVFSFSLPCLSIPSLEELDTQ